MFNYVCVKWMFAESTQGHHRSICVKIVLEYWGICVGGSAVIVTLAVMETMNKSDSDVHSHFVAQKLL